MILVGEILPEGVDLQPTSSVERGECSYSASQTELMGLICLYRCYCFLTFTWFKKWTSTWRIDHRWFRLSQTEKKVLHIWLILLYMIRFYYFIKATFLMSGELENITMKCQWYFFQANGPLLRHPKSLLPLSTPHFLLILDSLSVSDFYRSVHLFICLLLYVTFSLLA